MTKEELLLQRRHKGLTQIELATAIGYSRQAVIKWERGVHAIPDDVAAKIILACQDSVPSRADAKAAEKAARFEAQCYREMRQDGQSHAMIVGMWQQRGFTPCPEARELIAAEYPDILTPNPEK